MLCFIFFTLFFFFFFFFFTAKEMTARYTPDHPPYALMFCDAIRSLAEEGGSTEAAISEYIEANYDGLPLAHDRLLPYYLDNLVAAGLFVAAASGRYLIAGNYAVMFDAPKTMSRSTVSSLAAPSNGGTRQFPRVGERRVHERGSSAGSEELVNDNVVDLVEKSRPDLGYCGGYHFSPPVPKGRRGPRRARAKISHAEKEARLDGDVVSSLPPPSDGSLSPPSLNKGDRREGNNSPPAAAAAAAATGSNDYSVPPIAAALHKSMETPSSSLQKPSDEYIVRRVKEKSTFSNWRCQRSQTVGMDPAMTLNQPYGRASNRRPTPKDHLGSNER